MKSSRSQLSFADAVLVMTGGLGAGWVDSPKLRPQSSSGGLRLDDLDDPWGALGVDDARASSPAQALGEASEGCLSFRNRSNRCFSARAALSAIVMFAALVFVEVTPDSRSLNASPLLLAAGAVVLS